jgi:hypothetical protein
MLVGDLPRFLPLGFNDICFENFELSRGMTLGKGGDGCII